MSLYEIVLVVVIAILIISLGFYRRDANRSKSRVEQLTKQLLAEREFTAENSRKIEEIVSQIVIRESGQEYWEGLRNLTSMPCPCGFTPKIQCMGHSLDPDTRRYLIRCIETEPCRLNNDREVSLKPSFQMARATGPNRTVNHAIEDWRARQSDFAKDNKPH